MKAYVKKPVVVHAQQWFSMADTIGGIVKNFTDYQEDGDVCGHCGGYLKYHGWVDTGHKVCPGDWIIRGIEGEHYPCKPDIFDQTYDPVRTPLT